MKAAASFSLLSILLIISGCAFIDEDAVKAKARSEAPSCTVTLPSSSNGIFESGQDILLTVTAQKGLSPYALSTSTDYFATTTQTTRKYSNTGSSNAIVTDTVSVRDSLGLTAVCSYTVTIKPAATTPSNLACTITATPIAPDLNANTALAIAATGGTGSYTFSNLTLSAGGSIVTPLAASASSATATVKYASSGAQSASVMVQDASNSVVCSKTINVLPAPTLSIIASPSTSVNADSVITLSAITSGFISPTFAFSSTDSGALITPSGSTAQIRSLNSAARSFSVHIVASDTSGHLAQTDVALTFVANAPLICDLTHTTGVYSPGSSVPFRVTARTGEAVQITNFYLPSGTTVGSTLDTRTVQFNSAGTFTVYAIAQSISRGIYCNSGSWLQDSVTIVSNFSCNVVVTPNPGLKGQLLRADTTVFGGTGGAYLVDLQTSWDAEVLFYDMPTTLSARFYFLNRGVFPVTAYVRDNSGTLITCSTTLIIN